MGSMVVVEVLVSLVVKVRRVIVILTLAFSHSKDCNEQLFKYSKLLKVKYGWPITIYSKNPHEFKIKALLFIRPV